MRIAKVALLAAATAAASGGIAFAAVHTSSQPSEPGRTLPSNAASQAQAHAAPVLANHPSGQPSDAGKPADHPAPHGTPSPNLTGLCHAWLAGAGAEHGKARSNPAFSVLVATAGGSDAVDGYCTELIGSRTHPSGNDSDGPEPSDTDSNEPPSHPDSTDHPGRTDHPDSSSHPGNTDHPNRTSHPSGRP
jgi:hypothetical protein